MSGEWSEFLIHTVDIYQFKPSQDADGGATDEYPDPPYATAEPCYVEPGPNSRLYDEKRVNAFGGYTVFFGRNPGVAGIGTNDKIVWVDAFGTEHSLICTGGNDMIQVPLGGLVEVDVEERT